MSAVERKRRKSSDLGGGIKKNKMKNDENEKEKESK
jgi:hypothetical protein